MVFSAHKHDSSDSIVPARTQAALDFFVLFFIVPPCINVAFDRSEDGSATDGKTLLRRTRDRETVDVTTIVAMYGREFETLVLLCPWHCS